jgi:hypothetical protein
VRGLQTGRGECGRGGEIGVDAGGTVRTQSRGRVRSFALLRSAQSRCLRSLSLLALGILSSCLRRSHDAFSQACDSPQPRVPRPFSAPAPTEPAHARAACTKARSRTAEIQVGPGDTGSALVRISTRAASSKSWSSSCVPSIRREQSQRTDRCQLLALPAPAFVA